MLRNITYMLKFIWKADKLGVIYNFVNSIWNAFFMAANSLVLKFLIDGITESKSLLYMLGIALIYSCITLISLLTVSVFFQKITSRMSIRAEMLMSSMLLTKITRIDADKYDDPEYYDSLVKAFANADSRAIQVFRNVLNVWGGLLNIGSSVAIMAAFSPLFIVVCVISIVISHIADTIFAKKRFEYNEAIVPFTRKSEYFKGTLSAKGAVYDIKQYALFGKLLLEKFKSALSSKHKLQTELDNKFMFHNLRMGIVNQITTTFIPYSYLAYTAFSGDISIANMSAVMSSFINSRAYFMNLSSGVTALKEDSLYINHLRTILEYKPVIEGKIDGMELRVVNSIEFDNVSFKYPNSEAYALRGVSFFIKAGQKCALVGINGAGKTTIVKLLMRFYDPDGGTVRINGLDIREYSITSLRAAITSVFQEFQLYSLLVSELVSCEEGEAIDEARVTDALRRVGLYDKVMDSEKGIHSEYSKYFDESGLVFSGGQIQKMVIARMLYKDSAVYIMDEPSSALDPESEYEINRTIAAAARNKTVLLISHRLSTTKDADNIILIEDGKVCEQGSHSDLMAMRGRYAHLFTIQASEYI